MSNTKRPIWQFPWQYRESIAITFGVLLVGFLLQITLGSFNFFLLQSPVNYIVGGILILVIASLSFAKQNPIWQWVSGVPFSVSLIGALLVLGIIMGLTPQFVRVDPHAHMHWEHASLIDVLDFAIVKLGFRQVTTSWPFVLIYTLTLFALGAVIARRLHSFKWRDYAFYLNHFGLWLFIFAAGLGSADMKRYVMYVEEGKMQWQVYNDNEEALELPIAIELHDFVMEEYQPKLTIVNKHTGDAQPENRPDFYQIDEKKPNASLYGWKITLDEYIHEAVRKTDTTYQNIPMPGSMPAAKVTAVNSKTSHTVEGWVSCGSMSQFYKPLDLDSTYSIVMTKPEPKRFASDITVIVKDDNSIPQRVSLEVNSPFRTGSWMIYQYGYDDFAGKASTYSSFELVYDPWINAVYAGIILIALGSICMLWLGNKNNNKKS